MKKLCALFLAVSMLLGLSACGRANEADANTIPESTGGKDLARAESVDDVFSLNTNPNYSNTATSSNYGSSYSGKSRYTFR